MYDENSILLLLPLEEDGEAEGRWALEPVKSGFEKQLGHKAAGHSWVSPDICDFYLPRSLIFLRESESQKGSSGWCQGLDIMCTNRSHHHHLGYSPQCPHCLPANSYGFCSVFKHVLIPLSLHFTSRNTELVGPLEHWQISLKKYLI